MKTTFPERELKRNLLKEKTGEDALIKAAQNFAKAGLKGKEQ